MILTASKTQSLFCMMVWSSLILCASSLRAQDAQSLSLNEATNLAIENSPEIRQVQWLIEKAIADGYQKSRLVNPQVGTMANEIGNDGSAGQYGFFLQRNLVRNNRVEQIQNASQWQARGFRSKSKIGQRNVARATASIFIDIEYAQKRIALVKKKKLEFENIKKIAEALSKGGEISVLELSKLDLELETIAQELRLLELEIPSHFRLLQTYTGNPADVELDFSFDDEIKMVLHSSFDRDVDLDQHPSVEIISNQIEAQRWLVQVAQSGRDPDWTLMTSLNYDFDSDDFFGGFQVNVPWQVNDQKSGLIASRSAQIQILIEERNRIKKLLERKLILLNRQRQSLTSQIRNITKTILPKVDEYSKTTTRLFHAGEADYQSVKSAILKSFEWREKRLELSKDLLLIEAETETLVVE